MAYDSIFIYDFTTKNQILLQRANLAWRHVVKFAIELQD